MKAQLSPTIPDLLMHVGSEYTVRQAVLEYEDQGISKAIPIPPVSLAFGISRLFLEHDKAIAEVTAPGRSLDELIETLTGLELLTDQDIAMLDVVMALDLLEENDPTQHKHTIADFGITFHPGIFGYGYIQEIQYVCHDDEEELPENLAHLSGYVTPVKVIYNNNDED